MHLVGLTILDLWEINFPFLKWCSLQNEMANLLKNAYTIKHLRLYLFQTIVS